jgi:nicotinamidase-related amidase
MAARQYPQGLGDTIEQLRPFVGEYNDKTTFSCCGDADLLAKLRGAGRKNIIIIGL